jgi:hypothetical protein
MLAVEQQWQQKHFNEEVASDDVMWRQQQHVGGAAATDDDVWRRQQHVGRAADSKGGGRGEYGGSNWYNPLLFFHHCCGLCFYLPQVELYGRNSNEGNFVIFSSSQGIYPAGGRIHP